MKKYFLTTFIICNIIYSQTLVESFDNAVGNLFPDPPTQDVNYFSSSPNANMNLFNDFDHIEGTGSMRIEYYVQAISPDAGWVVRTSYSVPDNGVGLPYIDLSTGAYLSLWYKIVAPANLTLSGQLFFEFKLAEFNDQNQRELWFHRTSVNLSDSSDNWINILMPLMENLNEYAGFSPQFLDGDGILQLDKIKGFEIAVSYFPNGEWIDTAAATGIFLIDNLELLPGTKLTWTGENGFENDGVNLNSGIINQTFTYKVRYSDSENEAPMTGYPKLRLLKNNVDVLGSPFTMIENNSDPFSSGRIYYYDISNLSLGSAYTYLFEAFDINGNVAIGDPTVSHNGPSVLTDKVLFLNTKIFLQGNYSSSSMSTSLNSDGQLPISQPFNQLPWNYEGSESVSSIPLNVVDWVLVELRTSTDANSMVARRAGFLRSDGYIMDLDGVDALEFENVDPGLYYIVVYHRNHLPVMSSETYEVVDKSCPGIPALEYGGKIYHTVQIGDQCWLRENLDIGTMIQGNEEQTDNSIIEKYCYDNLESNCETYGGLYQWSEAMQYDSTEAVKGICPDGWHIPSYSDFNTLIDAVSGNGNELKAVGQDSTDVSGTNVSGFSAILVGYRGITGNFYFLENSTDFWSSSKRFTFDAYSMTLIYNSTNIDLNTYSRKRGVSIRCIKD